MQPVHARALGPLTAGRCHRPRGRLVAALLVAAVAASSVAEAENGPPRPVLNPPFPPPIPVAQVGIRRRMPRPMAAPVGDGLVLADRRYVQLLRVAAQLLEQGKHAEAVEPLQRLLEAEEDRFFRPDPHDRHVYRSLKLEVQRLIAESPETRAAYERKYGPAAQGLLDEALRRGRTEGVAEIARLFFHTRAGHQAAYHLAQHALDRGDVLRAALWFDRLRRLPDAAARFEPALSLQTALCWGRAGQTESAAKVLAELRRSSGAATLTVGGRPIELDEQADGIGAWLAAVFGRRDGGAAGTPAVWGLYRNNAARNPVVAGAPEPGKPASWRRELLVPRGILGDDGSEQVRTEVRNILRRSTERVGSGRQAALPKRFPLVVADRVIVRTLGNAAVLDLRSGQTLTETFPDETIDHLLWSLGGAGALEPMVGPLQYLVTLARQRTWHDATFGTMSSDGRFVYCVEDTGLAGQTGDTALTWSAAAEKHNRLACYRLNDGKLAWNLGGVFFLGPPLPLGGTLYCLAADPQGEIQLIALQTRGDGRREWAEPVWKQPLITHPAGDEGMLHDQHRRWAGTSVSHADGVLVCPTAAGAVVAVDVTTRALLWAYGFENGVPTWQGDVNNGQPTTQYVPGPPWNEPSAVIADGRVVLMPPASDQLLCLDLHDGTLLWKVPRGDTRYVAGVMDRRVLLVADDTVQSLDLEDGTPAWPESARIDGPPSGQGFIAGGRIFVPLGTGKIAVIDAATGRPLADVAPPDDHVPGNLVPHRGLIVSQNPQEIAVFPMLDVPSK